MHDLGQEVLKCYLLIFKGIAIKCIEVVVRNLELMQNYCKIEADLLNHNHSTLQHKDKKTS